MMQHRHRRRRRFGNEPEKKLPTVRILAMAGLTLLVVIAGKKTLEFFGVGNARRSTAAVLEIEPGGVVNVSVEGGPAKRAETDVKLYAGDEVITSPRNYARLQLFDSSTLRMNESTQVFLSDSFEGEEESKLGFTLKEGELWVATPKLSTYSGAIARTIETPYFSARIPSQAEAVLSPRSLSVFAADGLGLELIIAGNKQHVFIGEGQQFTLPPGGEQAADLYAYRNPLNAQQLLSPFVEESRKLYANTPVPGSIVTTGTQGEDVEDGVLLEVLNPADESVLQTATVAVNGRIGKDVVKVRINGYLADVDLQAKTFSEELALPDEDEVGITIEAINGDGVVVAESLRTVTRDRKPPEAPTITSPAANGETYVTNTTELEIEGTAPQGAVGIIVNDYRLQLFEPGDTDWSYLANTEFNNMNYGENVYEVIAINRGGYRSEAATITIVLDETAQPGIVTTEEDTGTDSDSSVARPTPTTVEESKLPDNDPLMPGSIAIYAPSGGTEFTTSNVENLIEGNVPSQTHSVWVNGYRLRLYEPGKTFFNYIASVELSTLKRGRNPYRITIRNDQGEILDEMTYVLNFQP